METFGFRIHVLCIYFIGMLYLKFYFNNICFEYRKSGNKKLFINIKIYSLQN